MERTMRLSNTLLFSSSTTATRLVFSLFEVM